MPHGGETGSIPRFYKGLLNEINTYLSRSFVLAKIFLNYLKSGKTQPPPGEVDHEAQSVTDPHGVTFTVDFYKFKVDFSYNDYDAKPPKGTKFAKKTEKDGFVVAHAPAQNQFMLHHRKEIADAISDGVTNRSAGVLFRLVTTADPGLDPNDPVWWVLVYVDADGVTELYYALFERKGAKKSLSMVPLEIGELYTEPLARVAGSTDVLTTRTRVSLDPAYIAFLKADKALPP
jgi:hypothetical protein